MTIKQILKIASKRECLTSESCEGCPLNFQHNCMDLHLTENGGRVNTERFLREYSLWKLGLKRLGGTEERILKGWEKEYKL